MNKLPRKRNKATSAVSSESTLPDDQDLEENPALATINVAAVEVPELTPEEQSDRLHLERRVERAFFEAGKALMELRDRRLYRSTHRTFEEYCKDRFSYTHRHVNYLIAASLIVDNITMGTNSSQILPTSEVQVRPLAKLKPQQQRKAWQDAVQQARGKVPSVGGLVLRYWAAKTLGKFYTRTLQTFEEQQIIQQAPYNIIRHPGYLGTFLMEIGASLAIANWIILIVIAVIGALSRFYRIQVEEEMLKTVLGGQYIVYSQETWKLIPFIY